LEIFKTYSTKLLMTAFGVYKCTYRRLLCKYGRTLHLTAHLTQPINSTTDEIT